MMMMMIDSL